MFALNQRVVCINADIPSGVWEFVKPLTKDACYTIRAVMPGIGINGDEGNVAVYLHEIHNTKNRYGIERGYNAERFEMLKS